MQNDTVKSHTDKIEITAKHETEKRGAKRFQYQIKIWKETFDFFGSQHDYEVEQGARTFIFDRNRQTKLSQKELRERRNQTAEQRVDKVKSAALACLVMDYRTAQDTGDYFDFIEEFWYENARESQNIFNQLKINAEKLRRVYTHAELEAINVLFENY